MSLEDEFWTALREIAALRNVSLSALAAQIDAERGLDCGLASAIRVFVLQQYRGENGARVAPGRTSGG